MITTFSAVVLAAGRSTRMGSDKAILRVGDRPLWQRQCEVLRAAGAAEIFLSARSDQPWAAETDVLEYFDAIVRDALPDCGPLGGIAAALAVANSGHLAVLAIDLPAMQPTWFRQLMDDAERRMGVVGRRGETFEPLAAVYPKEIYELAQSALAEGSYSLQRLIADGVARGWLRETEITSEQAALFKNWNKGGAGGP